MKNIARDGERGNDCDKRAAARAEDHGTTNSLLSSSSGKRRYFAIFVGQVFGIPGQVHHRSARVALRGGRRRQSIAAAAARRGASSHLSARRRRISVERARFERAETSTCDVQVSLIERNRARGGAAARTGAGTEEQ